MMTVILTLFFAGVTLNLFLLARTDYRRGEALKMLIEHVEAAEARQAEGLAVGLLSVGIDGGLELCRQRGAYVPESLLLRAEALGLRNVFARAGMAARKMQEAFGTLSISAMQAGAAMATLGTVMNDEALRLFEPPTS